MDGIIDLHPIMNLFEGCLPNYIADLPKFSHGAAKVEVKSLNLCKVFVIGFCQYQNELGTHFLAVVQYLHTMILFSQCF
jgi:hypothetical protein